MKKAVCISCTQHYHERTKYILNSLQEQGYECVYLTSDFNHMKKERYTADAPDAMQIPTRAYKKNISLARILSHMKFARDAIRLAAKMQPDLLYVEIPPNSLCREAAKFKRKHRDVKLIFDIFDLWPETFPSGRAKKLLAPMFSLWAAFRDRHLGAADFVTTECDLFRDMLELPEDTSATVHLCAEPLSIPAIAPDLREDRLELCYLGAINNVIDIPSICTLIRELTKHKPVVLHIIGKGERQQEFIDAAKAAGADVEFYGPVYDDGEKQAIMARCHFGLNMMKSSVCVGLTMKSVDYFRFGLPIINNIPADTRELVLQRNVGYQIGEGCAEKILSSTVADCIKMRICAEAVFSDTFHKDKVLAQYGRILENVI